MGAGGCWAESESRHEPPAWWAIATAGQPPLREQEHLLQPARAGLPKHPRQPAAAAHDDAAAEDSYLDAVVGPGREVRGDVPFTTSS
jgi:hypothetical protein